MSKAKIKVKRERLNTTLTSEARKELELFRVHQGFSGINEAIEYLTTKYLNGGILKDENKHSERENK